jgi:hypothetical protein
MKWKCFGWFQTLLFCILIPSFAWGRTYPSPYFLREETHSINIRYQSAKRFPSLQEKVGLTMGVPPFKDTYLGGSYVGHYIYRRVSHYLRSEPLPLEEAIRDSLLELLPVHGIETVPIPTWDGKEESLKNIEADSILMIEIKRFWAEGAVQGRGANINTSIYLIFRLGVKKESKVFRRDMYTIKEDSIDGLTPEAMEQVINQTLNHILDTFFSDPY